MAQRSQRYNNCKSIVRHAIQKASQIIVQARVDLRGDVVSAENNMFNLITKDYHGIGKQFERWKTDVSLPMLIDVFFDSHSEGKPLNVMLERWHVAYKERPGEANYHITMEMVEHQVDIVMRSLVVFLRAAPAYKLVRKIQRVKPSDASIQFAALAQEPGDTAFSSLDAVSTQKFATITTPYGFLDLEVKYRNGCNFPLNPGEQSAEASYTSPSPRPHITSSPKPMPESGGRKRLRSYSSTEQDRPRPNSPLNVPAATSSGELERSELRMSSFSPPNPPTYLSQSPLGHTASQPMRMSGGGGGGSISSSGGGGYGRGSPDEGGQFGAGARGGRRLRSDSMPIQRSGAPEARSEPLVSRLSVSPFKSSILSSSSTPDVNAPLHSDGGPTGSGGGGPMGQGGAAGGGGGGLKRGHGTPPDHFGSMSLDEDGPAPLRTYDSASTYASSPSTSAFFDTPLQVDSSAEDFMLSKSIVPFSNQLSDFAERLRNPPHLEMFDTPISNLNKVITDELSRYQVTANDIMLRRAEGQEARR
eukprot:TRINITY_DN20759_c0_g1_i1.p1 TRINITY_DN20759_c0_g1~~TRINITY_DN20759_c0_g1_i1.p1  ORF type:complete len:531 (-),score=131.03 TRINITY_DN20759_c0_g1_i1:214-1806(-)